MLFKVELKVHMLDAKCHALSFITSFFFFVLITLFTILKPRKEIIFRSPSSFIIYDVGRF